MKKEENPTESEVEEEDPVTKLNRLAKEKREAAEAETEDEILGQLSIRERLLARKTSKVIETVFEDDAGDFVVETRQMSSDERYRGLALFARISKMDEEGKRDIIEYNEAMKALQEIVQELIMTPGLEGLFTEGLASDDVIILIFLNTLQSTMASVGDGLQSFRSEQDRAAATRDVPVPPQDPS